MEGGGRGVYNSDEAKTRSKRTKEQVTSTSQAQNRNNTFQSDTPCGFSIEYPRSLSNNFRIDIQPGALR